MDCNHCDQTFQEKKTLQKHLTQNHSRVFKHKYQCKTCEKIFKSRTSLCDHLREDHENIKDRRDCSLCGLEHRNETELRRHSSLVHGDYINTLINNLQSDLPLQKPIESIVINDETFRLLEKNLDSDRKINSEASAATSPNLRRSKRIKKEINYFPDHQDHEKAEKTNKSEKIKGKKREKQYEMITLDSDSEEESSPTKEITPITVVSSQSRRISITNQKNCKTRKNSHNLSSPKWNKNEEKFPGCPPSPCDQCTLVFPNKKDLEQHTEDKHSLKCTKCVATIIFQTKSAFKVHNERNHQS